MKIRETIKRAFSRFGSFIAQQWHARPWRLSFVVLATMVLLALLAGCGARPERPTLTTPTLPAVTAEPGATFDELAASETDLLAAYEAAKAEANGLKQQAGVYRERLAREGFQNTAKWFNWAGASLCLLSAGLFLASFIVPPTIIPRRLAFGSLAIGLGLLAGSYLLVRFGAQSAWAIGAMFLLLAIHAGFALWPIFAGDMRRKLEAKGRALMGSEQEDEGKRLADKVTGRAIAEAANPKARRVGTYRGVAPLIGTAKLVEAE